MGNCIFKVCMSLKEFGLELHIYCTAYPRLKSLAELVVLDILRTRFFSNEI